MAWYNEAQSTSFKPEDLNYLIMAAENCKPHFVKRIKVTSESYNLLRCLFDREVLYGISTPPETYAGIPIEIDDTIENEYELVY